MSSFYDLASLVMIPSGKKAGKVYSQKPLTTDGQLDFTRASTATRIGSDGLIEKTRTNLLLQSNTFSTTWANTRSTETSGQSGYDGTSDAWLLESTATNSSGYILQDLTTSSLNTRSIYAKAGTSNWMALYTTGTERTFFDLQNGVIGSASSDIIDSKIEPVGNGWYRCSIAISLEDNFYVFIANSDSNVTTNSGDNIYIQDAQLEPGLVATNVITTTTAAVSVGSVDNMPRLNYTPGSATSCPSLLLEPQRTNIVTHSEYFEGSGWSQINATILSNATTSPEGVMNASKWIASSGLSLHNLYQIPTTASGVPHTASGYFKAEEYPLAFLRLGGVNGQPYVIYDLRDQSTVSTSGLTSHDIQSVGNGWYRITATATTTNLVLAPNLCFLPESGYTLDAGNNPSFTGDGTSGGYLYGAQLEEGSYATSYIPTFGATVTRVTEDVDLVNNGITTNAGTWYLEMKYFQSGNYGSGTPSILINPSSGSGYISILSNQVSNTMRCRVHNGSGASYVGGSFSPADLNKFAFQWDGTTFKFFRNGVEYASTSFVTSVVYSVMNLPDQSRAGLFPVNKTLFFPTKLTDAQCIELTSTDS